MEKFGRREKKIKNGHGRVWAVPDFPKCNFPFDAWLQWNSGVWGWGVKS